MDQGTAYIVTRLDKLTELQRDQGEILRQILAAVSKLQETASSRAKARSRPDWRQFKDSLWARAVILGILLAGNVTLLEAVKIAFK